MKRVFHVKLTAAEFQDLVDMMECGWRTEPEAQLCVRLRKQFEKEKALKIRLEQDRKRLRAKAKRIKKRLANQAKMKKKKVYKA